MALQGGHRFAVSMAEVFPDGVYALGVEEAQDYDEKTGRRTPSKDKQTGQRVFVVTGMDRDPEARRKEIKVKVSAPHMPELPEEILPGSGLRAVEFTGLTITPYVEDGRGGGRARLAFSYRATGVHAQGKAPTGSATLTGRSGGLAPTPPSGDGKAA
jgi:hypothetical protein